MSTNSSNFKQIKAQESNGSFYYKTQSGAVIKTNKQSGSVFEDDNGSIYALDLEDADITGTDKDDNITLFGCSVNSIDLGKGDETLNAMGGTKFNNQVVFGDNKGDTFNVEYQDENGNGEIDAFEGLKDWCKNMWNSTVNTNVKSNDEIGKELYKTKAEVEELTYTDPQQDAKDVVVLDDQPITDEDGNQIGTTKGKQYTDENGRVCLEQYKNYDDEGSITGYKDISYSYDENGNLRSTICTLKDADKNDTMKYSKECDENGRTTKESVQAWDESGNCEEKINEYEYNADSKPDLATNAKQTVSKYDANGDTVYSGSSEYDLTDYIRELASDSEFDLDHVDKTNVGDVIDCQMIAEANSSNDINDIINIAEKHNINIDVDTANSALEDGLENSQKSLDFYNDDVKDEISKTLNTRIDLIDYDSSALDNLCAACASIKDSNVNSDDYENLTKDMKIERLRKSVDSAVNSGDGDTIEEIWDKVNKISGCDSSENGLFDMVSSFEESREYYDSLVENNSDAINNLTTIRDDFDPSSSTPETLSESLLVQLDLIKDQIDLDYENSGCLDKAVSLANQLFDFGTSSDDLEATVAKYEEQVKNLSNLEGDEFIASYNALTGSNFSEEDVNNQLSSGIAISLLNNDESLTDETVMSIAEECLSQEDINRAKNSSTDDSINYDKLRTIVAGEIAGDFGASNSSVGGKFEDYKDTVDSHEELLVDLARTGAVAALSTLYLTPAGVPLTAAITAGAGVGGAVQGGLTALNTLTSVDAMADDEQAALDIFSDTVSGAISGAFQLGAGDAAKSIAGKIVNESGSVKIVSDAISNLGIKGVAQNTIQKGFDYWIDNYEQFSNFDDLTEAEQDELLEGLYEKVGDGVENGLISGTLLCMVSNFVSSSKIEEKVNECFSKYNSLSGLEGESGASITKVQKILSSAVTKATQTTLKTTAKTATRFIQGKDADADWVAQTSIKELEKELLK